jgi:hypothetical protein
VVRRIYFLVCTTQAQHFQPLAALEPLKQNLLPIAESYPVRSKNSERTEQARYHGRSK